MDDIAALRSFSRFYTQRLGLLGQSYLGSGLGITEVRVLWELANAPGRTARELAHVLGLDEGYLSRLLKGFERKGWLTRSPVPGDNRRRRIALTAEGAACAAEHDAASRAAVAGFLEDLGEGARRQLIAGLGQVRHALAPPEAVDLRDLAPGDAGWVIERHGALYARDEGYDASFEALVAEVMADFLRNRDPATDRGWIAWGDGRRLGSIFCVARSPSTAQLRLFFLEPEARGIGLGRQMLDTCLSHARAKNFSELVLWTHASHRAACRLYEAAGFEKLAERPMQEFGQDTVVIDYRIKL